MGLCLTFVLKEGTVGCEVKEFPVPFVYLELGKGCSHGRNLGEIPGR